MPHSVALDSPDLIMVPAREKIAEYVDYRVTRMNELLGCFTAANQTLTRTEIYDRLYGPKNLSDFVKLAAYRNLDL